MAQGVVYDEVSRVIQDALSSAKKKGQLKVEPLPLITLDAPKRPEWGDLATTVAMTLAGPEQRAPYDIAQIIVDNLSQREALFDRVDIVRPGFLNLTVKPARWLDVLIEIERLGRRYGRSDLGGGRRVLVEFVSANPTGPLHVGHGRGAAIGLALTNSLKASGYDVVTEYYINDAGRQMKLLGESVFARYQELHGRSVPFPEDGYQGDYIREAAGQLKQEVGTELVDLDPALAEQRCQELAYKKMLGLIQADLETFGLRFDSWCSEATLLSAGAVDRVLNDLRGNGLLFEEEGALWFRSSSFGDEKDRVVRKQDGEYTYLASDIAYHRDKLLRGYDVLIDIWGADHHGYIPRMQAMVQAFGYSKDRLKVVLVQMVNLLRGGKKVEMSKRAGEFITLREVIDEVGADAAKFLFLIRRSDTHLDFDLDLAKQRSADNPVYYVQYAHARVASLRRMAERRGVKCPRPSETDLKVLTHPDELALMRKLAAYPGMLHDSAAALEPHRITYYLQDLAALLHTYYNKHRILPVAGAGEMNDRSCDSKGPEEISEQEDLTPALTAARLALLWAVQHVIRNGLELLGVSAPEQM
jgi:arginyl-tRNA synthetase